ncbi:hypothetical protein V1509DRAFT_406653 [Lipomyces kononenkoae]
MAAMQTSSNTDDLVRKRRAHQKSRSGCTNCKLRRVKCDEGYPECSRCLSFGVLCNYDIRISNLQPRYAISQKFSDKFQIYKALMTSVTCNEELELELNDDNLARLERFRIRTVLSIGPPELEQFYENEVYRLTLRHRFLIQFAQALTSIHDRYLSSTPRRRTIEEIHYWTKGVTLFNNKISTPLHHSDRDAIWAAASMLGVITFASIEASTPEEAWPLTPLMRHGPEWFKMGQGKSVLQQLVRPDRPDSIFQELFSALPTIEVSPENVPQEFIKLYELDSSYADCNPYVIPVTHIFATRNSQHPVSAIQLFFAFNGWMHSAFGNLVLNKDPRTLLLMVYWYSKISTGPWWLRRRAVMEGQATCIYLETFHYDDVIIHDLLKTPRCYLFNTPL